MMSSDLRFNCSALALLKLCFSYALTLLKLCFNSARANKQNNTRQNNKGGIWILESKSKSLPLVGDSSIKKVFLSCAASFFCRGFGSQQVFNGFSTYGGAA